MPNAFSDFPQLPNIESQRPFSLPQQSYLLSQFLLEQCKNEAQRWLEGDYSVAEMKRMSQLERMECLNAYRDQLEYGELLDMFIEARNHLIEWGFEQLQNGPLEPIVAEMLSKKNFISNHPRLRDHFVEICMKMIPAKR